ncbi:carbonic anhydrase [Gammaproteobacteria bacterium]|nr:carbonic anhydrase [Gammaproteobacteria bacterium]
MTHPLKHLFNSNRAWAANVIEEDPQFFERLSEQQSPQYLWIGCSDSRVPASQIAGIAPGEVFVHRNIANIVVPSDLNCLSVIQFAVDLLKVKHILVVGHYGCSGIKTAMNRSRVGLADNWLLHLQHINDKHHNKMDDTAPMRFDRLCELNVIEQVANVARSTIVQDAWLRGQEVMVHGWIYGIGDGLLRDLQMRISGPDELMPAYQRALEMIFDKIAQAH